MATSTNCYPSWHAAYAALAAQAWTQTYVPSGCTIDGTGSVPCTPSAMRATAEAWLVKNAPQVLPMIGGQLAQEVYTFARYMSSEVGSGTLTERVAVGEAAVNQAKLRAGLLGDWRGKINVMLIPNSRYGAIHCPTAYCASIGKGADCNCANRWAATSRDPKVIDILLAQLVVSGGSGNFANGAATQWGPEYLKNTDGTRMGSGTTTARVTTFVRSAANDRYYWVGELPGVDPWHTFLTFKGPPAGSVGTDALIARGIAGLPLDVNGKPIRATWSAMPACRDGLFSGAPLSSAEMALAALASVAGLYGAIRFNRWLGHGNPL